MQIIRLDPYEYVHNPELFNHTKTGKIQTIRNTQDGFLSKAGATAMGLENAAPDATTMNKTIGNGTTQHWKSTYKTTVENSLTQPQ